MTNPMILNLTSSLLNGKTSENVTSLKAGNGNREIFPDMLKALHASKNGTFHRADKPGNINTTPNNKGYKYYLESFKKELLAQGKPLNKIFLKEKDLPFVKTLLFKCGFSKEKVEQFLKDLKANNSTGEFNLSQIFKKITELGTPKRKEHQDEIIAPATVPYIESILRDINLTPKELDSIFSKARVEGGGVDLHKLVETLKEVKGQKLSADKAGVDQTSLQDFIASMEQLTGHASKEKKFSSDIKDTLDKILERVEFKETDQYKSVKSENIPSFLKQKDVNVMKHVRSNVDASNHSGKSDVISDLNKKIELINPLKEEVYRADKEAGKIHLPKNAEAFNITDALKTVEQGEKPLRANLPASLVDQVGKQISRSILRGDQVLTLQLKPPDLGTVRIKIDIKDQILKLSMIAEHHSVKELLLNNVHELKEALVHHGIKLEKVDVQINSNFGQSLNASKEGGKNGQGWRQDFNGERFHLDNHTEGSHGKHINRISRSNLLDLVA